MVAVAIAGLLNPEYHSFAPVATPWKLPPVAVRFPINRLATPVSWVSDRKSVV